MADPPRVYDLSFRFIAFNEGDEDVVWNLRQEFEKLIHEKSICHVQKVDLVEVKHTHSDHRRRRAWRDIDG